MTMTEVMNILWNLYDNAVECDAFDTGQNRVHFREMLTNLKPEHRHDILELRDRALTDGCMDWAVELSHVAAAMSEDSLWTSKV